MQARYEKVRPAAGSFTAYERIEPLFPFCWHYHPEFELTLITEGEGQLIAGDGLCDYRPGNLVLLGPNLPHSYRSWQDDSAPDRKHGAIVVQFSEGCFGDRFFQLPEMKSVAAMLQRSAVGLSFGETKAGKKVANSLREMPSLPPARRLISLLSILEALAAETRAKALSTETLLPLCRMEDQQRMERICSYLHQNFDGEIDFKELTRIVHMSQETLCRFFRRATGRTMTTYIHHLRIGAAVQLLRNSGLSVIEIGFRVGFGNYSNFNRQFKTIKGATPLALRRELREG
jgi:AraC-like DNA-binding protein